MIHAVNLDVFSIRSTLLSQVNMLLKIVFLIMIPNIINLPLSHLSYYLSSCCCLSFKTNLALEIKIDTEKNRTSSLLLSSHTKMTYEDKANTVK